MSSKLGDYCDFQEGYVNPSQHRPEYFDGEIKWVRAVDLNNGFVYDTTRTLTSIGFRSAGKSAMLFEPDTIVISKSGTIGRLGIIKDYMCGNRATINIRPKHNCDLYFVFYFLRSIQQHLGDLAVGSVQKNLYVSIMENIEVTFPDLATQRKFGQFMLMFDSKIETNNKINNNLEQQAQAIFKEWFIDNPENNEWSTGTFSEIIKSTLNGDWGKEAPTGNNTEKVYCIRGADIPEVKAGNKGKMPTRYILPKNFATKQLTAGDIVVEISGGSPTQSTGRCTAITQSLLDRYDSGMVCTNFCKAMKPKEGYSLFIYYYWQYLYGKGVFFSYENGTTGIKNLDFSGFIETETILIPPVDKVIAFDDYCKSIFNQIFANGKQNEHLAI